jgi:hypothetical protein
MKVLSCSSSLLHLFLRRDFVRVWGRRLVTFVLCVLPILPPLTTRHVIWSLCDWAMWETCHFCALCSTNPSPRSQRHVIWWLCDWAIIVTQPHRYVTLLVMCVCGVWLHLCSHHHLHLLPPLLLLLLSPSFYSFHF